MADTFTREKRSWVMAQIRGKDTAPEVAVRSLLHRRGFRFRLHRKELPGRPDVVLAGRRVAIFVHGCFWHSHKCQKGRRPGSNRAYWNAKLERNVQRDKRNARELRALGWKRIVVWSCELKDRNRLERRLVRLLESASQV